MTVHFENYRICRVKDTRDETRPDGNFSFAVVGHNEITVTDSGWQLPDQKVLFTTDLCGYDGGGAACEAFIEGYKAALPPRPVTFVNSALGDE